MALESRRRSGLKPWNGPLCAQIFGSSHCCHLRAYSVAWPRFVAPALGALPAMTIGEVVEMSYTSRSCGLSSRSRSAHGTRAPSHLLSGEIHAELRHDSPVPPIMWCT